MITYILAVDTDPLFNQLDQKYYKFSPEKFRSLYQMKVGTGAGFVFFGGRIQIYPDPHPCI